jgi:hypothetical protein
MLNGFTEKEFAELRSLIEALQKEIARRENPAVEFQRGYSKKISSSPINRCVNPVRLLPSWFLRS